MADGGSAVAATSLAPVSSAQPVQPPAPTLSPAPAPASPSSNTRTVYEESLHYVRLHPTRRSVPGPSSKNHPDPLVTYPPPPSPPHSDVVSADDDDDEDDDDDDLDDLEDATDEAKRNRIREQRHAALVAEDPEFHSACLKFVGTLRETNDPEHSSSAPSLTVSSLSPDPPARSTSNLNAAVSASSSASATATVNKNGTEALTDSGLPDRLVPSSSGTHPYATQSSSAEKPPRPLRSKNSEADDTATVATATTTATAATTATSHSSRSSKRSRAKMAAKAVSKPFRKSYVGVIAGLASTVGLGQAMFLKATYQSPPDARGPRSGVERPLASAQLSSAEGHVVRIVSQCNDDEVKVEPTVPAASLVTKEAVREAVEAASAVVSADNGEVNSDGLPGQVKSKRILIIGDSLVSGVGGESSFDDGPSDGPALPRQVARYLSEMLHTDVQWNAMSLTGGDVRMLKRKIIPLLERECERGTMDDIWAVVVVTGVNDWKRFSPIRTANKFREDLLEFIVKIREVLGEDTNVFLPAIPGVHHTPRFHEPLRSIVIFLNDYWDSQKLQLSRSEERVFFVGQPPSHEWGSNPVQFFSTLDRVHPSELGYKRWAERIAEHMTVAFKKGLQKASDAALPATVNLLAASVDAKELGATRKVPADSGKTGNVCGNGSSSATTETQSSEAGEAKEAAVEAEGEANTTQASLSSSQID